MAKRIFLTGAAGFIGFHSTLALAKRGDEVLGFDNFNDYYSPELKRKRAEMLAAQGVRVIEGDICDKELLEKTALAFRPTHILHLAAQAGVRYSITNPDAYTSTNIQGFLNILELTRQLDGTPLTYASSSSVYGTNSKTPFAIDDVTDQPANLYGATKKANELMAYSYHHCYGVKVTGLRYFTVYGPWGRPDMAYFSFAEKMKRGQPIALYDGGVMERDFTYIDDIVAGTIAAIDHGADYAVFNLGNNRPVSVQKMVESLEAALGMRARKEFVPAPSGEIAITCADITDSQKQLGFQPSTSLEEGLTKFANWYLKSPLH